MINEHRKWFFVSLLLTTLFNAPFISLSHGEIVTDGSLGKVTSLTGPDFTIPETLGSRTGSNLFHSFTTFNLFENESATFTGTDAITNIIARVTGKESSTIDGVLRSTVGSADLFFINPNGILFGPHAVIDVPAAFHVSTASKITFHDGEELSIHDKIPSTLTHAPPQSFGFLEKKPSSITLNGCRLTLSPCSAMSLTSGDVVIQGDEAAPSMLVCREGHLQITAVGDGEGIVPIGAPSPSPTSASGHIEMNHAVMDVGGDGGGSLFLQAGTARIHDSILLSDNSGDQDALQGISMEIADSLEMKKSTLSSATFCQGDAGNISISAGTLTLEGRAEPESGGTVASGAMPGSHGDAGNIDIHVTGQMTLQDKALISSSTLSHGDAGETVVNVGQLTIKGTHDLSTSGAHDLPSSKANLGILSNGYKTAETEKKIDGVPLSNTVISQTDPTLLSKGNDTMPLKDDDFKSNDVDDAYFDLIDKENMTGIASLAVNGSQGDAGDVKIVVSGPLQMENGAQISSGTLSIGNAGTVSIMAKTLKIDGQGSPLWTAIASGALHNSQGHSGDVRIDVTGDVEIQDEAEISSGSFALGNAGNVSLHAGNLIIDGHKSHPANDKNWETGIFTGTFGNSSGDAGDIDLTIKGFLDVIHGGKISSHTWSESDVGNITIDAHSMTIDGQGEDTGIFGNPIQGSEGNAGTISLSISDLLKMTNGGIITSETFATGKAGDISITAKNMTIDGEEKGAGIYSDTRLGSGDAGIIDISISGALTIQENGHISSRTSSHGNRGNIAIHADAVTLSNESELTIDADQKSTPLTDTLSQSDASPLSAQSIPAQSFPTQSISVIADRLTVANHSRITSQGLGNTRAGDISLQVDTLTIANHSDITTSARNADGGAIEINGKRLFLDNSRITTSVMDQKGDGGDITIQRTSENESMDFLIMKHGFIQANTKAQDAKGGEIHLDIDHMIVDHTAKHLSIDHPKRLQFDPDSQDSVIQAAAPNGTKGEVTLNKTALLDISSDITGMNAALSEMPKLLTDPCQQLDRTDASSLIPTQKGAIFSNIHVPSSHSTVRFNDDRLIQ